MKKRSMGKKKNMQVSEIAEKFLYASTMVIDYTNVSTSVIDKDTLLTDIVKKYVIPDNSKEFSTEIISKHFIKSWNGTTYENLPDTIFFKDFEIVKGFSKIDVKQLAFKLNGTEHQAASIFVMLHRQNRFL